MKTNFSELESAPLGAETASDGEATTQARLAPQELLALAMRQHNANAPGSTVLLSVALQRSDHIQALAQEPHTQQVFTEISRRVEAMLRSGDRYCFVSPDEIWVLLCNLPNEELAELAGRTLRESLLRPVIATHDDGETSRVTLRPVVGGAWSPSGKLAEALVLVREAGEACRRAQRTDDNVMICRVDSNAATMRRNVLEAEVREALNRNELDVYFQPQIDVISGRCVAAEALVRWIRPGKGPVAAALIASLCEERGMMGQLTQFVLNTSLRHASLWKSQGIDVSVAINLSAVTLLDNTFPAMVGQALETWGVPADRLMLELTESSIVENEAHAIDFMTQLRKHGCRLSIDDFGTGYSSFSYLKQFPLSELKIDQSFVRDILTDPADRKIVKALVDLAHTFGLQALAEGVENASVLKELAALGCDRAQGYHFAKALDPREFADWFRRRSGTDATAEAGDELSVERAEAESR